MGVRSSRLGGPVQVQGTTTTTLFTTESGETNLVKWLTAVSNDAAAAHELLFYANSVTTPTLLLRVTVAALGAVNIPLWWVFGPGETLLCRHGVAGLNTTVSVHGAELEGVAD